MIRYVIVILFATVILQSSLTNCQEEQLLNAVKGLLQGDELQKLQSMYSALPLELRDRLSKDILNNPSKLGKDLLNLVGPHFQTILNGFIGNGQNSDSNSIEHDSNTKHQKTNPKDGGLGIEFGPLASLFGNLISSNPQMMLSMVQNLLQDSSKGFNFDSITSIITEKLDMDTLMSMASAFGLSSTRNGNTRGEKDEASGQSVIDILKLNQIVKMWQDFIKSPLGQRINRVVPRLLKSQSLPDALRLLEKETSFRFDLILLQLQDSNIRKILIAQTVKPIGKFLKTITIPKDLKEVIAKSDGVLTKLGLAVKAKDFIEPIFTYIRDTFKITRESLLDLKAEDIEKIASEVLNNEVLEPLTSVWEVYQKAIKNSQCSQFIFCQLNQNFYQENFIRRNVIKSASIISAFQLTSLIKNKDFSQMYESIYKGSDGYDCTMEVSSFCLELMSTAAHNEL